jgi:hypothetical protein
MRSRHGEVLEAVGTFGDGRSPELSSGTKPREAFHFGEGVRLTALIGDDDGSAFF